VGIRHPYERGELAAAITVSDCAVATSGLYERGPHILDPHTGRPASGLASVTVVGRDLGTVDAYATAAFARGDPAWTAPLAAMSIAGDRVFTTPSWPGRRSRRARAASRRPSAAAPAPGS
jgi:FAD:protein FMN transferase